ncbi:hypothetical protein A2Z00_04670 [Candidatus Gottesmanbacteria bacterium RBG_13_45_10]|uniref:Uncharacterized protein n=1 Tax=Candidatus Gottesmanbacteria bacterium RBG_13_45_10 TaxID=1798370 RepID=A0A1F5ZGV6_9BACT|nr:MAG: hypothetical protein A2Z00_04670 [Candidatus Gottesmanbacteria bacterium RBG_13_45_10]
MNTAQIQLKISLSQQLSDLLASKAARVGVPVTQLVKYLIIKEVEDLEYPTFQMSQNTEKRTQEAMQQMDKAVDASDFFKKLNES